MFNVRVKIETFKAVRLAQCFVYQRFKHSSLWCKQPPRCVKYGGVHLTRDQVRQTQKDKKIML